MILSDMWVILKPLPNAVAQSVSNSCRCSCNKRTSHWSSLFLLPFNAFVPSNPFSNSSIFVNALRCFCWPCSFTVSFLVFNNTERIVTHIICWRLDLSFSADSDELACLCLTSIQAENIAAHTGLPETKMQCANNNYQ